MKVINSIVLTRRFEAAFSYAFRLHAAQLRVDGRTPYIAHLMSVAALVLEGGGDEDEAIAALLHDAIEDQGGDRIRQEIRQQFGDRITQLVEGCTEITIEPPLDWRDRKMHYLAQLRQASESVQRVVIADKLHNLRSLLVMLVEHGNDAWLYFNSGPSETLWFYQAIGEIVQDWEGNPWIRVYSEALKELEQVYRFQ